MNDYDILTQAHIYNYGKRLLAKFNDLPTRFENDTVVPDQVEIHLPPNGSRLCWLNCSHCYTHTGRENPYKALSLDRLLRVLDQIADGHPKTKEKPEKIILSGFNTDPLNSNYVGSVARKAKERGFMIGVHTKGLAIPADLFEALLLRGKDGDYISFSVDAGSDAVFNLAHGASESAHHYTRIKSNIRTLVQQKHDVNAKLKIIATYLVTHHNAAVEEVRAFASDMLSLGVDHIRVSEPIRPVMGTEDRSHLPFPQVSLRESRGIKKYVQSLQSQHPDRVHFLDFRSTIVRILPCYSRWMFPTIGYDGYFYPCCLTASDQFASLRLADLHSTDFWTAYFRDASLDFNSANCQCDRKATFVNNAVGMELNGRESRHDLPEA